MQNYINAIPGWLWLFLAYMVYKSIMTLKARVIHIRSLFIFALVMTVFATYDIKDMKLYLLFVAVGIIGGIMIFNPVGIKVNKPKGLMYFKGGLVPLVLVILIFIMKTFYIYQQKMYPVLMTDNQFQLSALFAAGIIAGAFIGRACVIAVAFSKSPDDSTHFHKK